MPKPAPVMVLAAMALLTAACQVAPTPTPDLRGTVTAILTETAPTPTPDIKATQAADLKTTEMTDRIINATAVARATADQTAIAPTPAPTMTLAPLRQRATDVYRCLSVHPEVVMAATDFIWESMAAQGFVETAEVLAAAFSEVMSDERKFVRSFREGDSEAEEILDLLASLQPSDCQE